MTNRPAVSNRVLIMLNCICLSGILHAQSAPAPIRVKVVVVTMFEQGEDTGDTPGEFQLWVEREHLDQILPLPAGNRHVRMNKDGVLGLVTGMGTAKSAASIMAVGLDPRFDFSKAYWIVAGIAGGDPADVSVGSAVWADHVVDGDLSFEIDARQIPEGWQAGYVPLWKTKPYESPTNSTDGEVYTLNPALVGWAYRLTQNVHLADTDGLRKSRARFEGFPNAQKPPFVARGDTLSASTFWHGSKMDEWANAWTRYFTGGQGNYMTSAMEDSGTLQSLTFLSQPDASTCNVCWFCVRSAISTVRLPDSRRPRASLRFRPATIPLTSPRSRQLRRWATKLFGISSNTGRSANRPFRTFPRFAVNQHVSSNRETC